MSHRTYHQESPNEMKPNNGRFVACIIWLPYLAKNGKYFNMRQFLVTPKSYYIYEDGASVICFDFRGVEYYMHNYIDSVGFVLFERVNIYERVSIK